MLPNTILIVLLLTLMVQSLNAVRTVEVVLGGPDDPCAKYTEKGTDYLQITHVRVLESSGKNDPNLEVYQIMNNIVCNFESDDGHLKYTFKCDEKGMSSMSVRSGRTYFGNFILIGVRAIKQMLSGSIEYQYDEETMQMFGNGFLDPANMKNEKFHHNRHLHVKSITTKGFDHDNGWRPTDCHLMFPHGLISDHGLYVMRSDGENNFYTPMYYEPLEHDSVLDITLTNQGL